MEPTSLKRSLDVPLCTQCNERPVDVDERCKVCRNKVAKRTVRCDGLIRDKDLLSFCKDYYFMKSIVKHDVVVARAMEDHIQVFTCGNDEISGSSTLCKIFQEAVNLIAEWLS
jgi:CRISPR/Cas system-associated protein Cas10 (large subunit of type III CRISPR-Cas system)